MVYFIVLASQDTLQAAKRTFLTSTETKSPLKRPLTPEPDLEEEVTMTLPCTFLLMLHTHFFQIPSPASVKKVGIVTPSPHKKAKVCVIKVSSAWHLLVAGLLEDPVAEHCGRRCCSCSWEARR